MTTGESAKAPVRESRGKASGHLAAAATAAACAATTTLLIGLTVICNKPAPTGDPMQHDEGLGEKIKHVADELKHKAEDAVHKARALHCRS